MESLLELFDSGQFCEVMKILQHGKDNLKEIKRRRKLPTEFVNMNNFAVTEFMMTESSQKSIAALDLECSKVLQYCASVPATGDILTVELASHWNFMYVQLLMGGEVQSVLFYNNLYRTLSRVHKFIGIQHKVGFTLDMEISERCTVLLDQCVHCLLFATGDDAAIAEFIRCVLMWTIYELTNKKFSQAHKLLHKLAKLGEHSPDVSKMSDLQVLVIPLYVDHSQLTITPGVLNHVTRYMTAVTLCGLKKYREATDVFEQIEDTILKPSAKFLSGFCLYKMGLYTEGVSTLMEVLRSQGPVSQRLKARIHFLIGKCFSQMDKHQLAIQMYKEALCADFSYLVPLYKTSLQYRGLHMSDMELECLNLLVTALEMREECVASKSGLDLLTFVHMEDSDIQYSRALYCLANRSLQLERYDVAAEKYMQLLQYLKSWQTDADKESNCLPSLLQVHHEALEALLKNNQLHECITLCDKVLASYHNKNITLNYTLNVSNLNVLNQCSEGMEYSENSQTCDMDCDSEKTSQHNAVDARIGQNSSQTERTGQITSQSSRILSCSNDRISNNNLSIANAMNNSDLKGKRKFEEMIGPTEDNEHCGDVDVIALMFKAKALLQLKKQESALDVLQSAIANISASRRQRMQDLLKTCAENEPKSKRQKVAEKTKSAKDKNGTNSQCKREDKHLGDRYSPSENHSVLDANLSISGTSETSHYLNNKGKFLEVEHELYTMMSDVLESLKKQKDACHFRRLASQLVTC